VIAAFLNGLGERLGLTGQRRPSSGGAFPRFLSSSGPSTGAFPRLRAPSARNRGSTHWRLSLNAEKLPSRDQSPSATPRAQLSYFLPKYQGRDQDF
jgi:hypothetical protein